MGNTFHDTLSIAQGLKGAGMDESQAEATTEAIHGSMKDATAHLATKDDLAAVQHELQSGIRATKDDLAAVQRELQSGIRAVKDDLVVAQHELQSGIRATKDDLAATRRELQLDMKAMESRLDARISTLESRLLWRLAGMMFGFGGIIIAAMRLA